MEVIDLGEVRLAYRLEGSEGPWITLVHGGLVATPSWRYQLPSEAGAGLTAAGRVLAYDQRGYGESSTPAGGHDISSFAGDLLRLWDALGIRRSLVVGFSLGGFVALEAAVRAPDRVSGLVLESCGEVSPATRELFLTRAAAMADGKFDGEVALHVRRAFSPAFAEAHEEELAAYTELARQAHPPALAETFRSIAAWDPPASAAELECPKVVVSGSEDPGFGPEAGRRLQSRLGRCEHLVIPAAGHTPHYECPTTFNEAVATFSRLSSQENAA